jgi:hypothetical protein
MNRQQHHDEKLYQEFMAELEQGAAEYDRLMASGDTPARKRRAMVLKWWATAASLAVLLGISATLFVAQRDDASRPAAITASVKTEKPLVAKAAAAVVVPHTAKRTDRDFQRLTVRREEILTAMLPEVVFCPDGHSDVSHDDDVRLPQVSQERSFDLICKVVLPEVTAYADSAIVMRSTELMVLCDELCYHDSNF